MSATTTEYLHDHEDGEPVVRVQGHLDLFEADTFGQALSWLVEQQPVSCHLDLGGVTFIDSAGIHQLLRAHAVIESRGGELLLRNLSEPLRRVLTVTGLDHVVRTTETAPALDRDRSG